MSAIRLRLRVRLDAPLDAACIRPDAISALDASQIEALSVWYGNRKEAVGEFFDVRGGRSDEVHVSGDLARVKRLGASMRDGTLIVHGSPGMHTGASMSGGRLTVLGSVGDWSGAEMTGGVLDVRGDASARFAGAYPGSTRGMRGGMAIVRGSVGPFAGERMRRGLVAIRGSAGAYLGAQMVAGTILVLGATEEWVGFAMKRGTIVAASAMRLLPTFRHACRFKPTFLGVCAAALRAHEFEVPGRFADGEFDRWNGDFTEMGKGEILVWTNARGGRRSASTKVLRGSPIKSKRMRRRTASR